MATLRIGHSPDPDDAFMFYGFAQGAVSAGADELVHVVEDIESLNKRALQGELEVTAISAAAYPEVADHYRILACGVSMGRSYGPIIVTRQPMAPEELEGKRVAIPGAFTTAYLLLRFYVPGVLPKVVPFDQIMEEVAQGTVDAGVVIHEGQITYASMGFHKVLDLGEAWFQETGLPIPLGLDVLHRRLGDEEARRLYDVFLSSIRYANEHEDQAKAYAQRFSRGLDPDLSQRFVRMYVNEDTLHLGEEGRRALEELYRRAHDHGLIPAMPPPPSPYPSTMH